MEEEKVSIRLDLEGEEAKNFLNLRNKRGLSISKELVRQLIKEAVDKEVKGGGE